jgi:hypothetical protein
MHEAIDLFAIANGEEHRRQVSWDCTKATAKESDNRLVRFLCRDLGHGLSENG